MSLTLSLPLSTDAPAPSRTGVRPVLQRAAWEAAVWGNPRGNIFASSVWGDYKARLGWTVRRLVVSDASDAPLAFAQVQERRRGPLRLLRIQGGPLLTDKGEKQGEAVMSQLLDALAPGRFDLVAIDFERFDSPSAKLGLLAKGFAPVVSSRNHTLEVDLTAGYDAVLRAADPSWRKELRRAEQRPGLTAHLPQGRADRLASYDAFTAMYAALKRRKGFTNGFDVAAYRDLVADDPHHVFVEVRDEGEIVAVRIAHMSAGRCADFFAASSDKARGSFATTLAVSRLVEHAAAAGCAVFDFGGIDPAGNRGVYDFKRKLSRNCVQSGPTWLYGRTPALRNAAGALLALR